MITIKNIIRFQNKKVLFFILMCFQVGFANAFNIKGDSLINKFPINDPLNPHCPCHKYQKLADDEFKKFLAKDASAGSAGAFKINSDKNNSNYSNTFLGGSNLTSKNEAGIKKLHLHKRKWNIFGLKNKKGTKRNKARRLRRDNTACFHF